ncbi:MAG: hypothetical protein WCE61_20310 [Candidatus Acidiferrum sp.]
MATAVAVATSAAVATSLTTPGSFEDYENSIAQASGAEQAATNDRRRTWLWIFLAFGAASQFYFVHELLAAFALFAIGFVAVAIVVISFYMFVKCAELAFARLASIRKPAMQLAPIANGSRKPA